MTDNYIRVLGDEVFKSAGLLNLQRIFMDNCHMEVRCLQYFFLFDCDQNKKTVAQ